ncbi:MAG TPA: hypothetical protein VIL46_06865, partial [Gemmataceae bacterium]
PPADDPTLEDLVAYLDEELPPKERQAVEAKVALDAAARAEAEALKRTWDLLDYLPRAEASPTFTTRTLRRLEPAAAPGPAAAAAPRAADTVPAPRRRSRLAGAARAALAWAALVAAGTAAGYFGRSLVVPEPAAPEPRTANIPVPDVPVIGNLRLYRYADDLRFVRQLEHPDLFGDEVAEW